MKTDEVDITEIVELQASKVSAVGAPANGTPFLLLKAAAADGSEEEKDDGGIPDEVKDKIDAKQKAKKSDSPEADAQLEETTGESAKSESPEADAQQEELTGEAAKGDVQEGLNGTQTPEEAGHLATGQSQTSGTVTDGVRNARPDAALSLGGDTTANIPDAAAVDYQSPTPATTDGAGTLSGIGVAKAVASLVGAINHLTEQRAAIKDGKFLQVSNVSVSEPAVPLTEVASTLAACVRTLEEHLLCERVEAAVTGDGEDVWDMEDAKFSLESALRLVANIAIMESLEEGAEKGRSEGGEDKLAKAYKRLTAGDTGALRTARDHLSAVIQGAEDHAAKSKTSDAGSNSDEETIKMELTKSEFVASVQEILKADRKAQKRAEKLARKEAEEAEKNANNGGDIAESEIKPTKEVDSDNINAVKGEAGEQEQERELDPATKQLVGELETAQKSLQERLDSIEGTLEKIAKRPRPGGPSLDGKARGTAPAAEGRLSDVTKAGDGGEIEQLAKQLDEATDPATKSELGLRLTRARLTAAHEQGRL